jgi:hypothetical protein
MIIPLTLVRIRYFALGLLIIDNGNKQDKKFHLNTHNYTLKQVEVLFKILSNKFNLKILFNHIRVDIEFILKQN